MNASIARHVAASCMKLINALLMIKKDAFELRCFLKYFFMCV